MDSDFDQEEPYDTHVVAAAPMFGPTAVAPPPLQGFGAPAPPPPPFAPAPFAPPPWEQHPPPEAVGAAAPESSGHMLGLSMLACGGGAAIGTYYGKAWGAAAGGLFGGAAVNAVRAVRYVMQGTNDDDKEAIISGTYAVLTALAGAYAAYKAATPSAKKSTSNKKRLVGKGEEDEDDEEEDEDDDDE